MAASITDALRAPLPRPWWPDHVVSKPVRFVIEGLLFFPIGGFGDGGQGLLADGFESGLSTKGELKGGKLNRME